MNWIYSLSVNLLFKAKEIKLKYINIKDRQIQDNRIKTYIGSKSKQPSQSTLTPTINRYKIIKLKHK